MNTIGLCDWVKINPKQEPNASASLLGYVYDYQMDECGSPMVAVAWNDDLYSYWWHTDYLILIPEP